MSNDKRNSKFYVVGGPVQPGQDSCILRDSDMQLYARLIEGDYCHVLAPSHEGKTTLMAQTAARLAADGIRVATIDLAQISSRNLEDDVGRWYYSFAYRIVRDLRIKADLQTWWQERSGLTIMQRLREFFLEVVLTGNDKPVVIFIDRIEAALGQAIARQLLAAIRACHDARATEPRYQQLTFALLGSVSVGQRIPDGHDSPFDISTQIELDDFEIPELRRLAAGLGTDQQTAKRITQAVWDWTSGQPYLSQKVFRGLARRKNSELTDALVDDVVATLFLSPSGPRDEPHLSAVAQEMLRESGGRAARLSLYRRIRKGRRISIDQDIDVHRDLLLSGLVKIDPDGYFCLRNRIYAEAYGPKWISQNQPVSWKNLALAATIALIFVGTPIWYTQYLPQAYIDDLSSPGQDYVSALESYRRLSFLPGFGEQADDLFADYLVQQSRQARRLAEVERFSESLAEIPGRPELGARMLAEFWERRATRAMERGERDEALLFALEMLGEPTAERRRLLTELIGADFDRLRGTIRTPQPLRAIAMDPVSGFVTTLDEQHRVDVLHLADSGLQRVQQLPLLAEEVIPLQRRLVYQGSGSGEQLELRVVTDHLRPTEIVVELRAPSGRQVQLVLDDAAQTAEAGVFQFVSRPGEPLATLLQENINGTWTASFTDSIQGVTGSLIDWQVSIDQVNAEPPAGIEPEISVIPEPGIARQMVSVLSPEGRRALTWPADPQVRGDLLVWDIANGEILARIPRPGNFSAAQFARGHDAVLITAGSVLEFHDIATATELARFTIEPAFAPVLSSNGRYLVVDTLEDEGANALTVWDLNTLKEIGRLVTGNVAELVAADPQGRFMAVGDGDRLVRLWSVGDGELLGEYEHAARPTRISFSADGSWLITQDAGFGFRIWPVDGDTRATLTRHGGSGWDASVAGTTLLLGSLDRGYEMIDLSSGLNKGGVFSHGIPAPRKNSTTRVSHALLSVTHGFAATYDGQQALKFWQLPPLLDVTRAALSNLAGTGSVAATRIGNATALSLDGRRVALATQDGDVRILPADRQALMLPAMSSGPSFIGHLDPISRVTFSPSGEFVASGSLDGSIRVWESAAGSPLSFFSGHADGAVHDLVFSTDDQYIFSASRRSVIAIDAADGTLLAQAQIQSERPRLALSPDGQRVYIAGDRGGLTRWHWESAIVEPLIAPGSGIRMVAVDGDESLLATADDRNTLKIWEVASMVTKERRERTPAAVEHLSFTSDGRHLLAQSGQWLSLFRVGESGPGFRSVRFLPAAPTAVAVAPGSLEALVLTQYSASIHGVDRLSLTEPGGEALDISLDTLRADIENRFRLVLDEWGDPQPLLRR